MATVLKPLSTGPRALRLFRLKENNTTPGTEVRAGVTTFMLMAYIIAVNPAILTYSGIQALQGKGPPFAATVAATCLAAAIPTIAMGLWSNYPLAMAPGMGLNAVVAFQLVAALGLTWQEAMGVVVLEGAVITLLVVSGVREAVLDAVPLALKQAIGVGIGLFILFLGLYGGGFVKVPVDIGQTITAPPAVPLALGDFNTLPFLMAVIALALTVLFMARRINGGLLLGIVLATAIAITIHYITGRQTSAVPGKAALPERWFDTPDFSTFGQGLNFGVFAKLGFISAVLSVFSLMLSDFFDTLGTVIGIGAQGGWLTREGKLPRMFAVLTVDSLGAVFGGIAGSSSSTTFVESAGGVAEGGRTGLTSVVVGILFLMALFVAPVAAIVPPEATASALIVVGFLMCGVIREINFSDFSEGFPALITMVVMPLTYSISNGIGAGFLSYAFIKVVTGNGRAVRWPMWIVCLGFVGYFARPWIKSAFGV